MAVVCKKVERDKKILDPAEYIFKISGMEQYFVKPTKLKSVVYIRERLKRKKGTRYWSSIHSWLSDIDNFYIKKIARHCLVCSKENVTSSNIRGLRRQNHFHWRRGNEDKQKLLIMMPSHFFFCSPLSQKRLLDRSSGLPAFGTDRIVSIFELKRKLEVCIIRLEGGDFTNLIGSLPSDKNSSTMLSIEVGVYVFHLIATNKRSMFLIPFLKCL